MEVEVEAVGGVTDKLKLALLSACLCDEEDAASPFKAEAEAGAEGAEAEGAEAVEAVAPTRCISAK